MTLGIAIDIWDFWPEIFGQGGEEERKEKKKREDAKCVKSCIFTATQDSDNFIHMYEHGDIFMYIYILFKLQGKGKITCFRHLKQLVFTVS